MSASGKWHSFAQQNGRGRCAMCVLVHAPNAKKNVFEALRGYRPISSNVLCFFSDFVIFHSLEKCRSVCTNPFVLLQLPFQIASHFCSRIIGDCIISDSMQHTHHHPPIQAKDTHPHTHTQRTLNFWLEFNSNRQMTFYLSHFIYPHNDPQGSLRAHTHRHTCTSCAPGGYSVRRCP